MFEGGMCMANKDNTQASILNEAQKLFETKGFDNTSIQDIVDKLEGFSSGVIYYYFQSKKDILDTIIKLNSEKMKNDYAFENNGMETLREIVNKEIKKFKKEFSDYSTKVILKTPRMIGEHYIYIWERLIPSFEKVIINGIEDGSIVAKKPRELAELLVITLTLWGGFHISSLPKVEIIRKVLFYKILFERLDFPIFTDEIISELDSI